MKERLELTLLNNGYRKLLSKIPEVDFYLSGDLLNAHIVQVMNMCCGNYMNLQQFENLNQSVHSMFEDKGYLNIDFFVLIITDCVADFKEINLSITNCWMIDAVTKQLCVYETQMSEFYGLRKLIENTLNTTEEKVHIKDGVEAYSLYLQDKAKRIKKQINPRKVTIALLLINMMVFLIQMITGKSLTIDFMISHGALYPPDVIINHEYYRLITCMFMHFDVEHIFNNMIGLYFIGELLEDELGSIKFFVLYMLSGLTGSSASLIYMLLCGTNNVSAGASGAVYGLLGGLIYLLIINKGKFRNLSVSGIRVIVVIIWICHGVFDSRVDNMAHLGGMLAGLLLTVLLYRGNRNKERAKANEN
ncbi:MAG: rhomboid family intramembrane serine protease [Clostridia bacterium]|nr:rhomboid family intramembrane serine protease [Clostridia bacterium]